MQSILHSKIDRSMYGRDRGRRFRDVHQEVDDGSRSSAARDIKISRC